MAAKNEIEINALSIRALALEPPCSSLLRRFPSAVQLAAKAQLVDDKRVEGAVEITPQGSEWSHVEQKSKISKMMGPH